MRQGIVKYNNIKAGLLTEEDNGGYLFVYDGKYVKTYPHQFISFEMPVTTRPYRSKRLFPFFDGLIPEGWLLNIAAKSWRINKNDRMGLLLACCQNTIGAVSIHPINPNTDE
ncbi:MAG: HipA N-terminal domain-containing protein [Bacteroidales bacterium]|jgi:serine/threonine-protein kinase HipA|nr:HipA N-terminal domain-containing protein [Bacteroidales bacterium]MDD2387921.1 HipA N-terminal domain-containing protein [Bacteroidales bacterium]MDD4218435.1 HipA N-terminal domain-containing protein [Bacteroidales bacterium]MDY0141886.1 HipA N-terminal domain-containing protein [Bacteroidales bacterium]